MGGARTTPPALYAGSLVGVVCLGSTLLASTLLWGASSISSNRLPHALSNFWLALVFNLGKAGGILLNSLRAVS